MNLPPTIPTHTATDAQSAHANRLLGQLLVAEILLVSIWVLLVCTFTGSAGTVVNNAFITFVLIYPWHLVLVGIAIWTWVKRTPSPRIAALAVLLPGIAFPLPFLLNRLNATGPLLDTPQKLTNTILVLVVTAIVLPLAQPRKCARLLPAFALKSFTLNLLILLFTVSLYVMPIAFLLFNWGAVQPTGNSQHDGYLLAYGLGALVIYTVACTFPAILVLGYSGLSFFQNEFSEHRKSRMAQLIASLPLVLIGGVILIRMWLQSN